MKKAIKKNPTFFLMISLLLIGAAFVSCSDDSSGGSGPDSTVTTDNSSDSVLSVAPGDSIELDGESFIVLTNTYYTENTQNRSVVSARAATIELDDTQKNLIDKYKEWVNAEQMLAQIGVTEYLSLVSVDSLNAGEISATGDKASRLPTYNTTEVVTASDSIYFYNKNKIKIAQFDMVWESAKIYSALNDIQKDTKGIAAVTWMEEEAGLSPKSGDTLPLRKQYYTVDSDKYSEFRLKYEPNTFGVTSFPENVNENDLSKKQRLSYKFKYDKTDDGGLTIGLSSGMSESDFNARIKTINNKLYYQKIGDKVTFSYVECPDQEEETSSGSTTMQHQFALTNLEGTMFYTVKNADRTGGEKWIYAQASGTGALNGNVTESQYKNRLEVETNRGEQFYIQLTEDKTGSATTEQKIVITAPTDTNASEKTLLNMKVSVTVDDTEKYKNDDSTTLYTLSEAVAEFLPHAVSFSSETEEINGYTLPKTLSIRAKFLETAHNKDYTVVELTPQAYESTGFVYNLTYDKTLNGHKVPVFVETFAKNMSTIFGTMNYKGEDTVFAEDDAKDQDIDACSVDFANCSISDYTIAAGANLSSPKDSSDYRNLTGTATIRGVKLYGSTTFNNKMRIKMKDDDVQTLYVNFNGGSLDVSTQQGKPLAGVAIPSVGDTVTLSSANNYVKIPCSVSKTLTFNAITTAALDATENHGTWLVTDTDGKVLLAEKAVAVADLTKPTEGAKDYQLDITSTVYILYCRPEGVSTGGGSINSITIE